MLMVNENLFKNDELLHTLPFHEAIAHFQSYVSQSIDRAKTITNKLIHTVLIYIYPLSTHQSFYEMLEKNLLTTYNRRMFGLPIPSLFKALVKCQLPSLSNSASTFPKTNQSSLYKAQVYDSFNAHGVLDDVLVLRKILFSSRLELSTNIIVKDRSLVSAGNAVDDMNCFDHRNNIMQSFQGKLYHPDTKNGPLKMNMVEKIARSGLSNKDLKRLQTKYGKEGVIAILSKPPSSLSPSPRVTRTNRILAAVVQHYHDNIS